MGERLSFCNRQPESGESTEKKPMFSWWRNKPKESVSELWTGQTTIADVLAPASIDNGSRDYIVIDGMYHTYLYVTGYGYRTKNEAAWLSPLVEAGAHIGISFSFRRMPKDKILSRVSQKTMLNRSRMREVEDTRQDYEELDSAISSGFYLKEAMNREGQDFYYMTTVIEITADNAEELEERTADMMTLCLSMSMIVRRADYKHEQCFLSALPILSLDADIERKGRRNVLTEGLAASFPFSSFEICDPGGVFLGLNQYNSSVAVLDFFDSNKYPNGNTCIYGTSGAGKTFLLQSLAMRFRMQGIQVFIIIPAKGHEYINACKAIGGRYVKIAPSSQDCINIMEIRKSNLSTDYEIQDDAREDSVLAEKLQKIMIFFSLIKKDITQDELNLLDGAVIRTYQKFGITFHNSSLFLENGKFKEMPTLKDLYEELKACKETNPLSRMLEKFVTGSLSAFGKSTNVDLDNPYIVLDITDMTEDLKPLGMFLAVDYVWDKVKESRIRKKAVFLDETWNLTGAGASRLSANFTYEIFKLIRGYAGIAVAATQEIEDFFSLDDGRYGKGITANSRIKFILQLEEDEAFVIQKHLSLTDEETMQVIRNNQGQALLCANRNRVCIDIKTSPFLYNLLTTKRTDLEKRRKECHERKSL